MDRKAVEAVDENNDNSNDSTSSSDDKTYHFRKGSDLDGFESFGALYADGLFTDLAICCSGRVFRCHRVVMAASSAYIKTALSAFNGSEHNNCNTIMFLPLEVKVQDMEAILHFIYNGQVEVTRDAIESFLSSAKVLHIKGLANIKLVYNNGHKNNKNSNNSVNKSINNENQNNQNSNHFNNHNNCSNNENNSSNTKTNTNTNTNNNNNNQNNSSKRRNGIIGGQNRSPKPKTDLNFNNSFVENIPQNQSFHSSQPQTPELDSKTNQTTTARRKQKICSKALATNGFANNTKETPNGDTIQITIEDNEEDAQELHNSDNHMDSNDTIAVKVDDKDIVKKSPPEEPMNGAEDSGPAMPCLIQIDADPTTFPMFCSETNQTKSGKRRRSSSMRMDAKNGKNSNNSLVKMNRNSDPLKQMVRSSGRKLGFIQFHKKSPTIWNSSNKWKCDICNKLYGNKQTLKEHMDYFHSNRAEQIFTCSICSKEYTWKKSLMKHYRDIHQITNTSLSQIMAQSNQKLDDSSADVPALEWVTQSQDNSTESK